MSSDFVTYELDGAVALIRLNRPKKRNAINNAVVLQLRDAVARAGEEADGHGVNFSAGLDFEELLKNMESPRPRKKPNHAWHKVFDIIARGPIPFVAAMHGAVVGGGLESLPRRPIFASPIVRHSSASPKANAGFSSAAAARFEFSASSAIR